MAKDPVAVRGRPVKSVIRQNIVQLLARIKPITGYELAKLYCKCFASCTQRSIYYHLHKGVELEEISVDRKERAAGTFSWGPTSDRLYFTIGKKSRVEPKPELDVILEIALKEKKKVVVQSKS
ncbi:MAG TPA: hypothetical protein VK158_01570 [Acidobacteriota bacterium]|nr:hypothetical protein [Acidobacteriota bacterium]